MNRLKRYSFFISMFSIFLFAGCRKEVELKLPEVESKMVVESYIVPGLPFGVFLTESVNYLATPELRTIKDAVVTISYGSKTETLNYVPSVFGADLGFYISFSLAPSDPDLVFTLNVKDGKGRVATARTRAMPMADPDTVEVRYNAKNQAAIIVLMQKPVGVTKFYRFMTSLQKNVDSNEPDPDSSIYFQYEAFDYLTEAGNGIPYYYKPGDSVNLRFMEINEDYYDFLRTLDVARVSNGSPFVEPSNVISNIQGGFGIFTYTNYLERKIVIP